MIYERKDYMTRSVKFQQDDLCPLPAKSNISLFERADTAFLGQQAINYGELRKKARKHCRKIRKKGRVLSKISVMLVTLLFCFFVTDAKFFDGAFAKKISFSVQNKLAALWNFSDDDKNTSSQTGYDGKTPVKYLEPFEELSDKTQSMPEESVHDVLQVTQSDMTENNQDETKAERVSLSEDASFAVDGEVYYPITELDLSAESIAVLSNNTSYKPDIETYCQNTPKALENLVINDDEPIVLIVHTHGSECYTEYDGMYPKSENTRSDDTDKNVVRVGKEIADTLEIYGIPVLHLETMCDKESFIDAYNVSNRLVTKALNEHPSIRVVIDVHRDAIIRSDGESIKPTVTVAGQDYAQLMLVVGTDEAGYNHPGWRDNLTFAAAIQQNADKRYPGLFRPINLRPVPFNQWLSNGYILLEVGSNSNTLDEALLSAQAFGHTLGAMIKEGLT